MSTLKVTNIQATGETASRAVSGVAAAWVNFNGTGTIATRDSVNVASLTDNGPGDYTVNFSNAFGAADYAVSGSAVLLSTGSGTPRIMAPVSNSGIATTNTQIRTADDAAVQNDCAVVSVLQHGDLA